MAARFGAKIIPFGAVGEDDVGQVSEALQFLTYLFYQLLISILNIFSYLHAAPNCSFGLVC
jgi:hypothetical protein